MTGLAHSVPNSWRESVVMLIGGITVLAGTGQIVFRERALTAMGLTPSSGPLFLFTLMSVLTALFGCGVMHAWLVKRHGSLVILWAGLAKVAGSVVIAIGFVGGVASTMALLVAVYDAATGGFLIWYWRRSQGLV